MKPLTAVQKEIVLALAKGCDIAWSDYGIWMWRLRQNEIPIRNVQLSTLDSLKAAKLLVKKIPDQPPRNKGNSYILNADHPELTKIIPG